MLDTETMHLHHDSHHAAYVSKLNEAVLKEPSVAKETNVDNLLKNLSTVPESIRTAVRNYGGGHSNHSLLWQTLSPQGGGMPTAEMDAPIEEAFTSFEKLKYEVAQAAEHLFGSGWVWLVLNSSKKLELMTTPNQDSPLSVGKYPLLGIDLWEHAYYLRFRNSRVISYLPAFWNVVNWKFITARYLTAMKG